MVAVDPVVDAVGVAEHPGGRDSTPPAALPPSTLTLSATPLRLVTLTVHTHWW